MVAMIDEYFGIVFGIPHASALFSAAYLCLLVAAFGSGFAFGKWRR